MIQKLITIYKSEHKKIETVNANVCQKIYHSFFFTIFINEFTFAQNNPSKSDSNKIYRNLETISGRHKITKFFYRLVFKPVAPTSSKNKVKKKGYKKLIQKPYSAFEGKIIRYIHIETLDPFGYSTADTLIRSRNLLSKTANKIHLKSQRKTIRNLLIIRQNQRFDSLLVKESERLVRSQGYVRDVSFFTVATYKKSDSVDIFIRELDNWSIAGKNTFSKSHIMFQLNDKNFLGFGHEFKNAYTRYLSTGENAYYANYFIPNIRNTYINTTLHYGTDEFKNSTQSIAVDRPFFSPFAKWAAGAYLAQQFRKDSILTADSLYVNRSFKYNIQDYWIGDAFQLFKGYTENKRTTNFVSTLRLLRIRYLIKPDEMYDTLQLYTNENFYLAGIGITKRKFVQDKFIFHYGLIEDVPIGQVFSLTGGYQVKNNIGRLYLGARISIGNYYSWGYFCSNYEYGTFFRASLAQQGSFSVNIIYFTGLLEIGKWKFRQFVKPQVTIGINRFPYEKLTINDSYGIDDFKSSTLTGANRILFKFQTQSYAPWNLVGFHFGPYLICSFGMLGDAVTGFKNSKVYSQLGLGILIKNEHLVFNTFQFSISYYPSIPGIGQDVFKFNSYKTTDFGFRDFEIGKPSTIVFQ